MPDPDRLSISATQAAGLFNASPYVTRWMLYQHVANGIDLDGEPDARMSWGKKLQPLILEQAADDLKLEVVPNAGDSYVRQGMLGCTRDAQIICPDRGPGALETKCVFDYRTWMADWGGGRFVPRHHEIQLQQQMLVGDGRCSFAWGALCAWVAGEQHYFERKPIAELHAKLFAEAGAFFQAVADKAEPDPFGAPVELEWLTKLFPIDRGKVIDLTGDAEAVKLSDVARAYASAKEQERGGARIAEPLRAQLLAAARDAHELILPGMVKVTIGGNEKSKRLSIYVPDDAASSSNILMAG
jgi:hypothetical protein